MSSRDPKTSIVGLKKKPVHSSLKSKRDSIELNVVENRKEEKRFGMSGFLFSFIFNNALDKVYTFVLHDTELLHIDCDSH